MNNLGKVCELETKDGIEKLFFELASESRMALMCELLEKDWKLNDLARKLDLTPTEAFRQLQRLTEVLLVQKLPEGTYGITSLGKLVLQLVDPLEFVFKHSEYFLTHDVWQLPHHFISRIGDLSQTNLQLDTIASINKVTQMIKEADDYLWGIGESPGFADSGAIMKEKILKGVHLKFLGPNNISSNIFSPIPSLRFEVRVISKIPVFLLLSEKEAAVGFRSIQGRLDYYGFYGQDPLFLNWAKDLFLYHWERAKIG